MIGIKSKNRLKYFLRIFFTALILIILIPWEIKTGNNFIWHKLTPCEGVGFIKGNNFLVSCRIAYFSILNFISFLILLFIWKGSLSNQR